MDEQKKKKRDWVRAVGIVLVVIGVSMWVVYAVGKYGFGWDVTDRDFLPYHLAVIIPGMILMHIRFYRSLVKKLFGSGTRR
jgi:hypothetical protein